MMNRPYVQSLWSSRAEDIVRASYERAVAKAEKDRMEEMRGRLAIWRDGHVGLLKRRAAEVFDLEMTVEIMPLLRAYPNPLKRIVRRLSTVYARPTRRWLENINGSDEQDRRYQEFLRAAPFSTDEVFANVNWAANLCNTVLIRYAVAESGRPVVEVLTPDRFSVVTHPDDPGKPVIVCYSRVSPATINGRPPWAPAVTAPLQWVYWDPDGYVIMDNLGNVIDTGENTVRETVKGKDVGVLPFVAVHRAMPMDTFNDDASGHDLVDATLDVGVHAAALWRLLQWSSENQIVITRATKVVAPTLMRLGASRAIVLNEGDAFDVKNNQADPETVIRPMVFRMHDIAATYGIPPDGYDLTFKAASGVELRMHEGPLREQRMLQIPRFVEAEKAFYRLRALSHPAAGLDPDAQHGVDHREGPLVMDPKAALELSVARVEAGVSNHVDELIAENPELTESQALELFRKNVRLRNEYNDALRAGNLNKDPTEPSQPPEVNGAMGPPAHEAEE